MATPPSTRPRTSPLQPARASRRDTVRAGADSAFMRIASFLGILAIGTVLGAVLVGQDVAGWITGLMIAALSAVLTSWLLLARSP